MPNICPTYIMEESEFKNPVAMWCQPLTTTIIKSRSLGSAFGLRRGQDTGLKELFED